MGTVRTQADAERLIPPLVACRDYVGKLFVRARPVESIDLDGWLKDGLATKQIASRYGITVTGLALAMRRPKKAEAAANGA